MEASQKLIVFSIVALIIGAAAGAGAVAIIKNGQTASSDATYDFYIYFDDGNAKNGWYSASASDAGAAFEKAMKNANLAYEIGSTGWSQGYIQTINEVGENGWYVAQYLYSKTDKTAADASILYPDVQYGVLQSSNGWKSISGYDCEGVSNKLTEIGSTVFFLAPYLADYSAASPASVTGWSTAGPFA